MDPNAVVLEISSDEETGWDGHGHGRDDRVITGGFDDSNWIAELLDEVNGGGDCGYLNGSDDDSDEVVLVSEVLPCRRTRKKPTSKSSALIEMNDDCVVLDHDPGKPKEVPHDNPIARSENGDYDSDDLLVVSETGQVACRDYPHPRHLCIKFPFSSTPNESHCNQCYCYVCDSLAPCLYWGNGNGAIGHCHATEKIEFWKLERQNSKSRNKFTGVQFQPLHEVANVSLPNMNMVSLPPPPPPLPPPLLVQTPTVAHNPVQRPIPIQNRTPFLLSRNKYQPGLVSQHLIRTSSCTIPRYNNKGHHNYTYNRPVFKRTLDSTGNHHFYSSHRNLCRQQDYRVPDNISNNSASFPPPDSDSYGESPIPFQLHPPNHSLPCEASQQGSYSSSHGQRSTVDPKFFHGIIWPESQTNHLPAAQTAAPASEPLPPVAVASGGLVDYEFDNWAYDNEPCELGFLDTVNGRGKWC